MHNFYYIAAVYGSGAYGECDYSQTTAACSSITAPGTGVAQQPPQQSDTSLFLIVAIVLVALGGFVLTIAQIVRRRARLAAARAAAAETPKSDAQ